MFVKFGEIRIRNSFFPAWKSLIELVDEINKVVIGI